MKTFLGREKTIILHNSPVPLSSLSPFLTLLHSLQKLYRRIFHKQKHFKSVNKNYYTTPLTLQQQKQDNEVKLINV